MFENYKDSLFNDDIILKLEQRFKSDHHNVYTEEINKFHYVLMTIRYYEHSIKLLRIHTKQMQLKYVKVR